MKRILLIFVTVLAFGSAAVAQDGGARVTLEKEYHLFDFTLNASRLEGGINLGAAGMFTPYTHFGMGASLLYNGFYLDFLSADPQHKYTNTTEDIKWNDSRAMCINFGYQIPIVRWLRVMPMVGYAQTNEGITDGTKSLYEDTDTAPSWYHPYKVTDGSRVHYFNYGLGLSVQPSRWFSINLIGTRTAVYAGVAMDLLAFARER